MEDRDAIVEALRRMDARELGRRLRLARKARGYQHQKDAAAAFEFGHTFLNSIENGRAKPTPERLIQISDHYGLSVEWFLSEAVPPDPLHVSRDVGEIDHIALAALREIPPAQQRALVLEIWPMVRQWRQLAICWTDRCATRARKSAAPIAPILSNRNFGQGRLPKVHK
jgi:transcriptional regulator with XRE-family HTH domain